MNKAAELEGAPGASPNRWCWVALAFVSTVLIAPMASAWNDTGHMIAALIAYDRLPADVRATAVKLVHAHPRFHEDIEPRLPRGLAKAGAAAQNRWYFAFAATWPDAARRFEHAPPNQREALIARYSHSSWHYINLPTYLRSSDRRGISPQPVQMAWTPGLDTSHLNIVQALEMLSHAGCANAEPDAERALALVWIIHLIGDLHQPLHTTALYAVPAFMHGDRGGNDIEVIGGSNLHAPNLHAPNLHAPNLHALWDGALGNDRRPAHLDASARDAAHAATTAGAQPIGPDLARDFQTWARQGRTLAALIVYTADIRAAVAAATSMQPPRVRISSAYRETMRATARRQIGLAGDRLAAVLQKVYGASNQSACSGVVNPR